MLINCTKISDLDNFYIALCFFLINFIEVLFTYNKVHQFLSV